MRKPRMKVEHRGCYYHLTNRLSGPRNSYPLTDVDKEKGFAMIRELTSYYLLEIISVVWMGNHFHVVLYAPSADELPSDAEIAKRHNEFYGTRRPNIDADDREACAETGRQMIDISHFMRVFQQKFAQYFNRMHQRRGGLWADRFKSTILEQGEALWSCAAYVELNPVRAGLVQDCAEYRFGTWGRYCGSGRHPFAEHFVRHMRAWLGEYAADWSDEQVMKRFASRLARITAYERGESSEDIEHAAQKAKQKNSMPLRFLRRTRHWSDGAVIGSKSFVQETAALCRESREAVNRQFSRGETDITGPLHCFKRLRLG